VALPKRQGDSEHWNDLWGEIEGEDSLLYVEGTPRTLLQFWQRCYFEDLWALVASQAENKRFLELGAGRATTSMYLCARDLDVTLVDLAPRAFVLTRRNYGSKGIRLPKMVLADAQCSGLKTGSFDCVYNIGVLEHFEDPRPLLTETLRVLKPGGLAFLVVVPRRSFIAAWLPFTALNPYHFVVGLAKRVAKALLKRAPNAGGGTRTFRKRRDYVKLAKELGATGVFCLPYNPYFKVYHDKHWETRLQVPAYRRHREIRLRRGDPPWGRTLSITALCDLLMFSKTQV
jgi:SAM-dependent methyltransferase